MTNRRSFIKGAGLAGAGVLAAPAIVKAQSPIKWRFQTYAGPALGEHVTKPIIDAIKQLGGEIKTGNAPPSGLEKAIQGLLESWKA